MSALRDDDPGALDVEHRRPSDELGMLDHDLDSKLHPVPGSVAPEGDYGDEHTKASCVRVLCIGA